MFYVKIIGSVDFSKPEPTAARKRSFRIKKSLTNVNMHNKTSQLLGTFYIFLIAIFLFGYPTAYYLSSETIEITIKDKERITTGTGEDITGKFILYSENEVFENTDSWLFLKFNSADYQNKLEVGKTYKVKVAGWRVPFLSMYRNVVGIL
jgi:hypothetical protein